MDEDLITGMACRWCRLGAEGRTIYNQPAFVVAEVPLGSGRRSLVLVPKAHVDVVTELPRSEMAAVLAGLTRASKLLRQTSGAAAVRVHPRSGSGRRGRGHLHFELDAACTANRPGDHDPVDDRPSGRGPDITKGRERSVFASLAEAIGH
jgi:diadenosine tetraphosphate (Ap4A) HIT family hydrolase